MKNITTLLSGVILTFSSFANPVLEQRISISELYFDESGHWVIELVKDTLSSQPFSATNIWLMSLQDSICLNDVGGMFDTLDIVVLYEEKMEQPFTINMQGDKLSLTYESDMGKMEDNLAFGNVTSPHTNGPNPGQSICNYQHNFVLDQSPTIGQPNDTSGIFGTVSGVIYDNTGTPVVNTEFKWLNPFTTDENGSYMTKVFATIHEQNYIEYGNNGHYRYITTEPINFSLMPGLNIQKDIHLVDELTSIIPMNDARYHPVKLYPNPVKDGKLYYEIELPLKSGSFTLEVYNAKGKMIQRQPVNEPSGYLELPNITGLTFVNILMDNKHISSHQILLMNE